ncbi:transmembrane protein 248-like isoform X3 [Physella acuta]|nr:transmembrane protein 248-like isoform X3 [Physella acuta]XP_059174268.1 transmembrane protein 248-like isoform X3 [Physella acuta]XP_059174269.1 transmembrane protein 248-like isoform X3 [Physella acuta]XP_059174270.1 transmembrane protein 248-like isoform X3 [Physella acuta]
MAFIIVENLRGFFNSRPPLVVFMICLASFAIALITFAYIVKTKEMANPDVSEDWNTFLTKFSKLDFCVPHNASMHINASSPIKVADQSPAEVYNSLKDKIQDVDAVESRQSKRSVTNRASPVSATLSREDPVTQEPSTTVYSRDSIVNVTMYLNIKVAPTPELLSFPLNLMHLTATITGKMLDLKESQEHIYVTMIFASNLTKSNCEEWLGSECRLHTINTCVTFTAPAFLLPHTQKPKQAEVCGDLEGVTKNMSAANTAISQNSDWCHSGGHLRVEYSLDDSLTVMLSQQERSLINLHLMRTSYFLFVMVVTMFCYAMIKGRPGKIKTVHVHYDKVTSQP